jgi:hypothetical protein
VTITGRSTMRGEGADQNRTGESFRSTAGTKALQTARFQRARRSHTDFVTPRRADFVTPTEAV